RLVDLLTNERTYIGGTWNASEARIEDQLCHAGRRLDLGFQNVRLRWEQHAELQLLGSYLIGDGVCRFDEHFVRHSFGVCSVNSHPDSGKDIEIVGLRRQECLTADVNRGKLHSARVNYLAL